MADSPQRDGIPPTVGRLLAILPRSKVARNASLDTARRHRREFTAP